MEIISIIFALLISRLLTIAIVSKLGFYNNWDSMRNIEDSSMLVPFIIGVSGHRDIDNTTIEMLRERIKEILKNFQIKYPHLPVKLLTPLVCWV